MTHNCSNIENEIVILNTLSGKVLNINGSSCVDESDIILYSNSGVDWEKWKFKDDGTIESVHCSGKFLSVRECGVGSKVFLHSKSGSVRQKWDYTGGKLKSSDCDRMVVDVHLSSQETHAPIVINKLPSQLQNLGGDPAAELLPMSACQGDCDDDR